MNTPQPVALKLAEMLPASEWLGHGTLVSYARECVAELLTQHAENETLRAGYAAARLEVESLKAQLAAAILAEREACAKVCEAHAYGWEKNPGNNPIAGFISASNCAGDIRLRSNAAPSHRLHR